jgi:hypothetical protein
MTVTGRPWDELEDTLTWPRIDSLYRYWEDRPPVHELAAAFMGIKPKEKQANGIEEIMALFEGGVLK